MEEDDRIGRLEDELRIVKTLLDAERAKRLEERLKEAREELAEVNALVGRMREHVTNANAQIDRWIDAFDLQINDKGGYFIEPPHLIDRFNALAKDYDHLWKHYSELLKNWNDLVPRWNAMVAKPKMRRAVGRPLAASDAQCRKVLQLAEAGKSLRFIMDEMNLGMQTVRTIISRKDYSDRATLKHLEKIDHKPIRDKLARGRKRTRDALLSTGIAETLKAGAELLQEAKGI